MTDFFVLYTKIQKCIQINPNRVQFMTEEQKKALYHCRHNMNLVNGAGYSLTIGPPV